MKAQLNFRFDQLSKHLTETFLNLFSSKRLCDVRLIGDDGVPVMGHRVILAAFSRTLNDFIEENSAPTLEIRIQGMNYHDLERIIQFMYLGEASVAHAETDKFLRTGKFLGVSQLSDQCKADTGELSREFSVDGNFEMNIETLLEDDHKISEEENLEEHKMRIGVGHEEVNLEEEINDDTSVIRNDFVVIDDFIIGEPALYFNIFSSVLFSHNFYRKVRGKDGSYRAFCLMCWKKDKTQKLLSICGGNIKGVNGHMAAKHAEFVDEYVKQREKVETMKKQHKERQIEFKQQQKIDKPRIRLERKERKQQEIQSMKLAKIDRKLKNKELEITLKTKNEKLRAEKRKQFLEAQAKMQQFAKKMAPKQTTPQNYDNIDLAEKVLKEEFTIGELSDDPKFNVFSSVFFSHNFYRKCDNGARVLCLMCLKSGPNKKVFLRLGDHQNQRGIMGHMQSKHPEHEKIFHLQNEIIKGLRNDKREGRSFISKAIV